MNLQSAFVKIAIEIGTDKGNAVIDSVDTNRWSKLTILSESEGSVEIAIHPNCGSLTHLYKLAGEGSSTPYRISSSEACVMQPIHLPTNNNGTAPKGDESRARIDQLAEQRSKISK
jgi:hypothetical protein